jgi:hypothetical protein
VSDVYIHADPADLDRPADFDDARWRRISRLTSEISQHG